MSLAVGGRFALDEDRNPPRLKPVISASDGVGSVQLGRGVVLRLGHQPDALDALLDARIVVDAAEFTGLGSVTQACAVFCTSNACRQWALEHRRFRTVAKVIGVMADQPRYVVVTQPRLARSTRTRRESKANRIDSGLITAVLVEPVSVECPYCSGPNIGEVTVVSRVEL